MPPANEVWAKVMFLHLSVCSQGGLHPGGLHPVGVCIQRGTLHPVGLGRHPALHQILWDTVNDRAVRILLERILVFEEICFRFRDLFSSM